MALDEITKASYLPNTLLPKANSKRATSALNTCKELLEQSIDRLKMASDQVGVGDLHSTLKDPSTILNLRLELGDVNTFSTNCLDEIVEAQDPQLQQLMQVGITNAKELAVNMLDVVSTYQF
uniref:Pectinesterase inhibitor domain-containing protein n=1 Tax=Chenopodium quinoa TaxID=63459 RepID=A0A803LEU2_CHEQI